MTYTTLDFLSIANALPSFLGWSYNDSDSKDSGYITNTVRYITDSFPLKVMSSGLASIITDYGSYDGAKQAVTSAINLATKVTTYKNYKNFQKVKFAYDIGKIAFQGNLSPLVKSMATVLGMSASHSLLGEEITQIISMYMMYGTAGVMTHATLLATDATIRNFIVSNPDDWKGNHATKTVEAILSLENILSKIMGAEKSFSQKGATFLNKEIKDIFMKNDYVFVDNPQKIDTIENDDDYVEIVINNQNPIKSSSDNKIIKDDYQIIESNNLDNVDVQFNNIEIENDFIKIDIDSSTEAQVSGDIIEPAVIVENHF